jgi:hypothetical protein
MLEPSIKLYMGNSYLGLTSQRKNFPSLNNILLLPYPYPFLSNRSLFTDGLFDNHGDLERNTVHFVLHRHAFRSEDFSSGSQHATILASSKTARNWMIFLKSEFIVRG